MKIETNDWTAMGDAYRERGIPQSTFYRAAKRLGLVEEFFGVRCIRIRDIQKVVENCGRVGNPDWIESHTEAAKAAVKAVKSRLRRIEEEGMTEAEKERGERIKAALAKSSS